MTHFDTLCEFRDKKLGMSIGVAKITRLKSCLDDDESEESSETTTKELTRVEITR